MADKQEYVPTVYYEQGSSNHGYPSAPPPGYVTPPNYARPGQTVHMQQYASDVHYQLEQQPGAPPEQVVIVRQTQLPPPDYTTMAIIVTVCCCLPFGIVGVVKASEAKNLYLAGNHEAAHQAAKSAGAWSKAGLIFGIILYVFVVAFCVIWIAIVASIGYT